MLISDGTLPAVQRPSPANGSRPTGAVEPARDQASTSFDYDTAFRRNLGWVTTTEQNSLRRKRIAIGGLGGVGGSYLIALTRLGIGSFALSDLDGFDLSNFNRQYGATTATLGKSKLEVLVEAARSINPEIEVGLFPSGLDETNYRAFLNGADVYLDSLDLFATPLRWKIFDYCHANGIAVVTAAPIGMSSSMLVFTPEGMSPAEYFGVSNNESVEQQIARFLVGVNPRMKTRRGLIKEDGLDVHGRKLPSLVLGIEMCTAVACSTVLKLLIGRGEVRSAPWTCHFDALANEQYYTWRPFGFRNPLQRLMFAFISRRYFGARSSR